MEFLIILKAILSRLLLFGHGITAVYIYNKEAKTKSLNYWFLITPLVFLFIESCVTCIYRSGREYKYVWPSGFFYITCIIPIIWLIELDLYELQQEQISKQKTERARELDDENKQEQINREIIVFAIDHTKNSQLLKKICELGLMICIIIARWLMPRGSITKDQLSALLLVYVGNSADILELFDTFEEPEVLESKLVLICVMCIFTWSMYQFALVTTATVSEQDIPNMDVKPHGDAIGNNRKMSAWSSGTDTFARGKKISINSVEPIDARRKVSTISHTDPFGRTRKASGNSSVDAFGRTRKVSLSSNIDGFGRSRKVSVVPSVIPRKASTALQNEYIEDIRTRTRKISVQSQEMRGRGRKNTLPNLTENVAINEEAGEQKEQEVTKRKLHGELYQILVSLLMQDGPFLILRLYLIVRLNVSSEMHIFFTCKNAIVSLLLIYRLLILSCRGTDEEDVLDREEAATKLHNIQMAMQLNNEFRPLANISVK